MSEQRRPAKSGSDPQRVKVDATFEEAVRKALRTPKPPEGFPDHRVRERRPKREVRE